MKGEFIFTEYDIQGVIHFAADKNPGVQTNGTFTLIDVAYKYWMSKPFTYKENSRFHHISTDEVSEDPNDLFTEKTPYAPNSPYSASKASSDMSI